MNGFLLSKAVKESRLMGTSELERFRRRFLTWGKERAGTRGEALVDKAELLEVAKGAKLDWDATATLLEQVGEDYVNKTNRRSACLRLSRFMARWASNDEGYVRILSRKPGDISVSRKCLDPRAATGALNSAHSSILMSGTLVPLDMHADLLGLDKGRTMMKEYKEPVP